MVQRTMTNIITREAQLERIRDAYADPRLMDYLAARYAPHTLLQRGGERYPVVLFPAHHSNPDDVLRPLSLAIPPDESYVINDPAYREAAAALDLFSLPSTVDRLTFTMEQLHITEGNTTVSMRSGRFMASAQSSECLDWEIRSAVAALTPSQPCIVIEEMTPLRRALHAHVADPVTDGRGRSAAVGITCLLVYRRSGAYYGLMRKRGKRGSPLYAFMLQGLPSFMFQANAEHWQQHEYSVSHQVGREYLEECYSFPEPEDGTVTDPNYFYTAPQHQALQALLSSGAAELFVTGIGINILNLRPEICTMLVIHDEKWIAKALTDATNQFQFNDEWESVVAQPGTEAYVGAIPIDPQNTDEAILRHSRLVQRETTPAGAAAFWSGIDCLRRIL